TLVDPRVTPPVSLNRTKIRLLAGSNGTGPVPVTKMAKVGVCPELICIVTLLVGAPRQAAVAGAVWHNETVIGSATAPVSADALIWPPAPRLTVATANAPLPPTPATSTIPLPFTVAAKATTSGVGIHDAENNTVFNPIRTVAGVPKPH